MPITNLDSVQDLAKITPEEIDSVAKSNGKAFADTIKTNQVRNVFSSVMALRVKLKNEKEFTEDIKRDLILLKPKMAYAAGRQKVVKPFYELLAKAIDSTATSEDPAKGLNNFISLVESIVAYHKFYGGRDK